jgi:subtilisin family serine protease
MPDVSRPVRPGRSLRPAIARKGPALLGALAARRGPALLGALAVSGGLGVLGPGPAHAAGPGSPEWWLTSLQVTQAWRQSEGSGITVAVLGTGVDASYPGLSGAVRTGPDETGTSALGRAPGGPFWGGEGTAVAELIAGHGSGPGLTGVAPEAKILSVRVTLEFNDPLAADQGVSRRLPAAIAAGIRYAASHGARIIDLPLDPGTLGLTGHGDPAAAGGSTAERAAVRYALGKGIVLIAPAGDDRDGPGIVNYPAAYPGVIAVGAVDRSGQLAQFSSTRSAAKLTAPGVALTSAVPPDTAGTISSTSAASAIVAGVAALVRSRYPRLTVAQVTRALVASTGRASAAGGASLPPLPSGSPPGAGYGTVNATRALAAAAVISAASLPPPAARATAPATPAPHRLTATATATVTAHRTAATALAGAVLRDAVAAVGVVIVLLLAALLALRARWSRRRRAAAERSRNPGQHEQHPGADPTGVPADHRAGGT